MKKIRQFVKLSLLILLFISPLTVFASDEATKDFYSYIEVQQDGSIKVSELIRLNGEYNGFTRDIEYKNAYAKVFSGQKEDLEGSDIYNGSSITDVKVGSIPSGNLSFDSIKKVNQYFNQVSYAQNRASHVYTAYQTNNGISLKIYNPSTLKETFYIEYIIHDAVVMHDDVAELAWNVLGNGYKENIGNFQIKVVLPEEDEDVRVWLKGPLNGEVDRTKDGLEAHYSFLGAYNAVSVRLLFDKSIVPNATKLSNMIAKDDIISIETEAANLANEKREAILRQNNAIMAFTVFWFLGAILLTIVVSMRAKKSKRTEFSMEYYRDFPAEYGPEVLQYLLERKVDEKSLSAIILNLVYKKVLTVEEMEEKKKKDYKLVFNENHNVTLTEPEKAAMKLLIETIGNGKEVILSGIKKYCSKTSHAEDFMSKYNKFLAICRRNGKEEEFYASKPSIAVGAMIICLLGIPISIINFSFETDFFLGYLAIFIGSILTIVIATMRFYTPKGAKHYAMWMAHKKFLKDFSRFDEKELPEVILWDKYLVYATILGCADELSKQMQIKINTMEEAGVYASGYDPFLHHYLLRSTIYSSINRSVHTAVSSSRSSIAASRNSSGGGFGGGASFGGGSFGGGGGGGRF